MLLLSYLPFDPSFVSIQFLVLNLIREYVVSSNRFIIFSYRTLDVSGIPYEITLARLSVCLSVRKFPQDWIISFL